jgi:hypothetical protein
MNRRPFAVMIAGALLAFGTQCTAAFAQDAATAGVWEGPWYRGMTSGKVKIDLRQSSGTIQFTNLDGFGTEMRPLDASLDSGVLKLRAEGEKGGPLTANLKLNEAGTEMKGLGKFDGFPLRFEVKRAK